MHFPSLSSSVDLMLLSPIENVGTIEPSFANRPKLSRLSLIESLFLVSARQALFVNTSYHLQLLGA